MELKDKRSTLVEQRARLLEQAKAILHTAEIEGRDLRPYEAERFDKLSDRADEMTAQIKRLDLLIESDAPRRHGRQVLDPDTGPDREHDVNRRRGARTSALTLAPEQRMAEWRPEGGFPRSEFDEADAGEFSLGRVVRGMVTGRWDDAELERRALAEGTNAAGGFLTPEPLATSVIDRVRNAARVLQAGATTVPMTSDSLSIPRLASGVTGAWRNENAPVAESDPTFERVTFTARTLAVLVRISYELVMDLTPAGAQVIENELVQALALELDRVALRGSGTAPEPRGIRNTAGVELQAFGGANGAAPTDYTALVNAVATIQGKNITPNAAIYASRTGKTFATLADTTGQPKLPPPLLEGLKHLVTNQVPVNLTTGTSTDTSEIYVGYFPDLLIAVRPSVGIDVQRANKTPFNVSLKRSDERYVDQMQVGLLAYLRADVAVAHPESFAVVTGVRP